MTEREKLLAEATRDLLDAVQMLLPACCLGITNYNNTGKPCSGDESPESSCCIARAAKRKAVHAILDLAVEAPPLPPGPAPAGWKLVPLVPTEAMIAVEIVRDDGGQTYDYSKAGVIGRARRDIYRAMIAAAPPPPTERGG